MKTPGYIKALVQPTTQKPAARKVWSVGLEEVWLPFFTATNVLGTTRISKEALGAPLRLQREKDGTPRFSQNGKPSIRVNAELNTQIRFVRENMVMSWMNFAGNVQEAHPEEYKAEVEACQKAGRPIIEKDAADIEAAIIEAEKKARLAAEMEKAAADAMEQSDKTEDQELVGASA